MEKHEPLNGKIVIDDTLNRAKLILGNAQPGDPMRLSEILKDCCPPVWVEYHYPTRTACVVFDLGDTKPEVLEYQVKKWIETFVDCVNEDYERRQR